eukprot:COSAG04_NODE_176_length_21411_cov_10.599240_10_plen_208_part_00
MAVRQVSGVGLRRGSFRNFDLIGRGGLNLVDYWADGPSTFLGIHSQGFPNMFVLVGPQAPAIITNVTYAARLSLASGLHSSKSASDDRADRQVIEQQVLHIVEIVKEMQAQGHAVVECTQEAEANWVEHCVRSQPRPGLLAPIQRGLVCGHRTRCTRTPCGATATPGTTSGPTGKRTARSRATPARSRRTWTRASWLSASTGCSSHE